MWEFIAETMKGRAVVCVYFLFNKYIVIWICYI